MFVQDVVSRIDAACNDDPEDKQKAIQIIHSEDTSTSGLVIRIRPYDLGDDGESQEVVMLLRELADLYLNNIILRGFEKINKVHLSNLAKECVKINYDPITGESKKVDKNFIIQTDGVDLAHVLSVEGVDATRTTSNHIIEILQTLGIEAARMSLIKELRMILDTYAIYVNYRHLSTLVDVMTQRGIFTSITRHGINRVNSGPLRKCSFEETAEILLEAAFFGEHDTLTGITENIIFGQLAPYGTGSVDLIVDQKALLNCIQNNTNVIDDIASVHSGYVSEENEQAMTPIIDKTPHPGMGQSVIGSTWSQGMGGGAFTPNMNYNGLISPSDSQMQSPGYNDGYTGNPMPQTPGMGGASSPYVPGYATTPIVGSNMYDNNYNTYSPAGAAGSGSAHAYSPTNLPNQYQSPAYSPTTPGYVSAGYGGGNNGAMPAQSNTYAYGAASQNTSQQIMTRIMSPSQSPANRGQASNQGANAPYGANYGYSGSPSSARYVSTPQYQIAGANNRPGMNSNAAGAQPAGAAYNPDGHSESSDDDQ